MAKPTESSDTGWSGFLTQLLKSFLLLRDLFGYGLPGAVFLSIGVFSSRTHLQDLRNTYVPYPLPVWAWATLIIAACYVVGQILASIAYLLPNLAKCGVYFLETYVWGLDDSAQVQALPPREFKARLHGRLEDHPTEVTADLLEIRQRRPNLFIDLDRRETGSLFVGSTMAALLAGFIVFHWTSPSLWTVLLSAGILLLIDFSTAIPHLRRVRKAVRNADGLAPHPAPPADFNQALLGLMSSASEALKKE